MLDFLINEKILTFSLITGVFTTSLIASLKINLLDPLFENMFKSDVIDVNNNRKLDSTDLKYSTDELKKIAKEMKTKIFLKDLVLWLLIILFLYLIYKFLEMKKK